MSEAAGNQTLTSITDLSLELITEIVCNLDLRSKARAACVCSTWRDAVYQIKVWRGAEVELELEPSTNPTWFRIIPRKHQGEMVLLPSFLQEMNYITELRIGHRSLVTEIGMQSVTTNFKNLVSLNLASCRGLTDSSLLLVSTLLLKLSRLNLSYCWDITDAGIAYLAGRNGDAAIAKYPRLKLLILWGCTGLTDFSLLHLASGQRNLKFLGIDFGETFTANGLEHLAKLVDLQELRLRNESTQELSQRRGLMNEIAGLVNLQTLSFTSFEVNFRQLFREIAGMNSLRNLHVDLCTASRTLFYLDVNMTNITTLTLQRFYWNYSLESFSKLINLHTLKFIEFHIPVGELRHIARIDSLKTLHLEGRINSAVYLADLAMYQSKISTLFLIGLCPISDIFFRDVTSLVHLQTLHLEGKLSMQTCFLRPALGTAKILHLKVRGCPFTTDLLDCIVDRFTHLQNLDIGECVITNEELAVIVCQLPDLVALRAGHVICDVPSVRREFGVLLSDESAVT